MANIISFAYAPALRSALQIDIEHFIWYFIFLHIVLFDVYLT